MKFLKINKLKFLPVFIILILNLIFFSSFIFKGNLPIPSDTIVGLYYPFREIYFKTNPNGLPYKNFLVTDPVRQQYPWRSLAIGQIKKGNLPLWNPYNFAGTPLLANFQSGAFYPFNILFFIFPFSISWSLLIFLEPLLAGIFLYYYLDNLKLKKEASLLGAVAFSFSGFFIAWLEWGTILNTALWLPIILLSIDKISLNLKLKAANLKIFVLCFLFIFSLTSSFLAGHLQTFFYLVLLAFSYFVVRFIQHGRNLKTALLFVTLCLLFFIVTSLQWYPALKFIFLSARNLDLPNWTTNVGWFIPWQNLIQFLFPDFFGNPATLNYYGIWNYGEFIGYIGIFPLIMAFFSLFFRKDKKTLFFGVVFFLSLIFSLPTIFAKIPYKFEFPFLSTAQPTRLLFLTDFSLSVLAAFGLDYFIRVKDKKPIYYVLLFFLLFFILSWGFVLFLNLKIISPQDLRVAKQNMILPTILFMSSALLMIIPVLFKNIGNKVKFVFYFLIILTVIDLFRFGLKFEPFTNKEYLFPPQAVISFLQSQKEPFRVISSDSKIFPPNFSIMYRLQTLDGYDPLYLQRYGEFMVAYGRGTPDISPPFGFNRIITPQNPSSRLIDLVNVKYILSLEQLKDTKLKQVFSDGQVFVYENSMSLPRAFFVNTTLVANSKQEAISALYDLNYPLNKRATVENVLDKSLFKANWDLGQVKFDTYSENKVIIETNNPGAGFLVLTDSYYPTWHALIDGKETKIYLTDYDFRGIIVPKGQHTIEFYDTLF